jgi:hypothetical protein
MKPQRRNNALVLAAALIAALLTAFTPSRATRNWRAIF